MRTQKLIAAILMGALVIGGCGSFGAASIAPHGLATHVAGQDAMPSVSASSGISVRMPFGDALERHSEQPVGTYYSLYAQTRPGGTVLEGGDDEREREYGNYESRAQLEAEKRRIAREQEQTSNAIYELTQQAQRSEREAEVLERLTRQAQEYDAQRQAIDQALDQLLSTPMGSSASSADSNFGTWMIMLGALAIGTYLAVEGEEDLEEEFGY